MTPDQKERAERLEAQDIEARERLNAWLELPIVAERFRAMDRDRFNEFKEADTDEKRAVAWHRARALQDLLDEINGIQNAGKHAAQKQETRREQEARAARTTRK